MLSIFLVLLKLKISPEKNMCTYLSLKQQAMFFRWKNKHFEYQNQKFPLHRLEYNPRNFSKLLCCTFLTNTFSRKFSTLQFFNWRTANSIEPRVNSTSTLLSLSDLTCRVWLSATIRSLNPSLVGFAFRAIAGHTTGDVTLQTCHRYVHLLNFIVLCYTNLQMSQNFIWILIIAIPLTLICVAPSPSPYSTKPHPSHCNNRLLLKVNFIKWFSIIKGPFTFKVRLEGHFTFRSPDCEGHRNA